jgi:hypothetical protein
VAVFALEERTNFMSDDHDNGAYKGVRADWEQALTLAGDDKFKQVLVLGLHNLTAQIENDMAHIRSALHELLHARGIHE